MRRTCIAIALISFGLILAAPMAWACQSTRASACSMPNCSMPMQTGSADSPTPEADLDQALSGCELANGLWVSSCFFPATNEPARADFQLLDTVELPFSAPLSHSIAEEPPERALFRAFDLVFAYQHELGRFTLLSSFLL